MSGARRLSHRLRVDRLDSGRRRTARPLVVAVGRDLGVGDRYRPWVRTEEGETVVCVPAGFVTDFSSIPWALVVALCALLGLASVLVEAFVLRAALVLLAILLGGLAAFWWTTRKVDLAGVVHDLLYRIGFPRGLADLVWRIVAASGPSSSTRVGAWVGWLGLRIGGGFVYNPTGDPHALPTAYAEDVAELREIAAEESF